MTTFHKPPEYLTVKEYIYDIPHIPFSSDADGYIVALSGYEAVLRDAQEASHRMARHYRYAKSDEDDLIMYRVEKERYDLLYRQLDAMSADMRGRFGICENDIHRDVNLLRDKRSCGLM